MSTTACPKCGKELAIGDFPFCPHDGGVAAAHGDELDYIDHNLGRHPIRIRSKAQRKALMAAAGLTEFIRHTPVPGTDKSPYTTPWTTMDAKTLSNAQELLARIHGDKTESEDEVYEPVANPFNFTATPEMVRELAAAVAGVDTPKTESEIEEFWKDMEL